MSIISRPGWILLDENDKPVEENSNHASFRGEILTVTGGEPPHKPDSTGRIYTNAGTFYPSVCGLLWARCASA